MAVKKVTKDKEFEPQVRIINFSKTEQPVFLESRSEWVNAGADNMLFENLIEYSNYSSTHKSILQTKIDAVSGDEVIIESGPEDFEPNPTEPFSLLLDKLSSDLEIMGAYALEVIYSLNNKKIVELNHLPLQNMRYAKMDADGKIRGMYYSRDWTNIRKYKPIYIPMYNSEKPEARQVLLVKKYWPGNPYTILPSYYAALNYIKIDNEISQFHLSNLQGGMNPGLILSLNNGQFPDKEKADKMVKALEKKFGGSAKAGQMMVLFNKSKEEAADIKQLENNNLHDMFNVLIESVSQQILTAHQLTNPQLAGIKTPGELGGGGQQLLQSYELFYNLVINKDQKLLEDGLNKVLAMNGIEISIQNSSTLKFSFSESLLMNVLTKDELREMLGYEISMEDILEEEETETPTETETTEEETNENNQ